jgi:hypothetical protein
MPAIQKSKKIKRRSGLQLDPRGVLAFLGMLIGCVGATR